MWDRSGEPGRAEDVRILGVDLGEVRIGLALSDVLGISAHPLESLSCVGPHKDVLSLARIVQEHGVKQVVVGFPLLMSGEEGQAAASSRRFAERLRKRAPGVGVELWDERLTTVQAERTMIAANVSRRRRKQVVDGLAAVLILQNFLDSRTTGEGAR